MVNLFIKLGIAYSAPISNRLFARKIGLFKRLFSNPNQATVDVSDLGDIRTLKIEPKHGISGIYAR